VEKEFVLVICQLLVVLAAVSGLTDPELSRKIWDKEVKITHSLNLS